MSYRARRLRLAKLLLIRNGHLPLDLETELLALGIDISRL